MDYAKYKGLRDASWRCLIECEINVLPISLGDICTKYKIGIVNDSAVNVLDGESGRIVRIGDKTRIIVNDGHTMQRRRFTIAHELGHFLLGHLGSDISFLNREIIEVKPEEEMQADMFAIRLLSPACVLWGLNLHTAEEIAEYCDISLQAASYRAERMAELYRRNCFLRSSVERTLYKQFEPFIKQNTRH